MELSLATPWVLALSVFAGALTTVSGMGGGMLLVIALAAAWGPHVALPVTALALMVGNLHRLALFRSYLRPEFAWPLIAGLVPGSLIGALLVAELPAWLLHAVMLALVVVAVARACMRLEWSMPRSALGPGGGVIGVLAATGGGAAVMTGPMLLATGIDGDDYLATVSLAAVAMHLARTVGYGVGGLVAGDMFVVAGIMALCIVIGNWLGRRVRSLMADRNRLLLQYCVLIACAGISLSGLR